MYQNMQRAWCLPQHTAHALTQHGTSSCNWAGGLLQAKCHSDRHSDCPGAGDAQPRSVLHSLPSASFHCEPQLGTAVGSLGSSSRQWAGGPTQDPCPREVTAEGGEVWGTCHPPSLTASSLGRRNPGYGVAELHPTSA